MKKKQSDEKGASVNGSQLSYALYRRVLYKYVSKLNDNVCFRCGKAINSIDEFSLEHKIPYNSTDNPKEYAFNLDNIAFSHLRCNSSFGNGGLYTSSRYRGVCYDKQRKNSPTPWRASITVKGKLRYIGHFETQELAAMAYDKYTNRINNGQVVTNKSLGLLDMDGEEE